jgi:putative MATE family efflux protein
MIAHSIGARQISHARRFSEVSFFYNSLISIPFFLILLLLGPMIMSGLGTSPEINLYGSQYMRLLSYSLLFLGVEMSVTSTLQGMGKTKHIMVSGIIKTVVNIFLDWTLIYGKWGFPEMGIEGAALATSIANAAAALYLLGTLVFSRSILFRPGGGILKPRWSIARININIGFPSGLESIMWALAQIVIIRITNEIDVLSAGIYLMVARIQAVTFFFYVGIARGTMTLVGQKMGAGNYPGAIRIGFLGLRYSFLFCIVASIIFLVFPEAILSIFTTDASIIKASTPLFTIIAITIYPIAINVVIGHAIRGMKDPQWMFMTQILGTVFTIGCSAILIFIFDMGITGIFITTLTDETTRAILNFIRFYKGREFFKR